MFRLLWRSARSRASIAAQGPQGGSAARKSSRHASSFHAPGLKDQDGWAVLYRGPPSMSSWVYFLCGSSFLFVGLEVSYNIYRHFTWPLSSRDPENPPRLAGERMRIALAAAVGLVGSGTAFLFFAVPSKTVTKLTLHLPTRQLAVRTATREFSALFPRQIYPAALRKTAELRGYYKTEHINERIVPLSMVYRIRGSATAGSQSPVRVRSTKVRNDNVGLDERHCLEIRAGMDRFWYRMETAGGREPPSGHGYAGFWRRLQHRLRGSTDWEGTEKVVLGKEGEAIRALGDKEAWFADRQTFDDVFPLVKRK